jgi:hypothetical protein
MERTFVCQVDFGSIQADQIYPRPFVSPSVRSDFAEGMHNFRLTLIPMILETTVSSHDVSCIMKIQERSFQIMPETAIVTNERVERQITLQIHWVPGHIPSMIINAPYQMLWLLSP